MDFDELLPGPIGGPLSRRALLGRLASAGGAAVSRSLLGGSSLSQARSTASAGAAATVQRFRSRPDLRPPAINVDVAHGAVAPGVILTDCHEGPGQQGPMIIDGRGRLVWFLPVSGGGPAMRAFNVRVQQYQGKPVISFFRGAAVGDHGAGHYEIYDQTYRLIARVQAGNGYAGDLHEFLLTDKGTALFTCYGKGTGKPPGSGSGGHGPYLYGVVQEVDVASGRVLFQWRSDEHVGVEDSYRAPPASSSVAWDYFHVNSIAIDPSDGNLLISGRNTWAVYKVDRHSGRVLWTLGGKRSNFHMGPRTRFAFQHDVVLHPGGKMTIFDNEAGPPHEASQSRGLVLSVNESRRTATFSRQYLHRPPVLSGALGSVQPLGHGHVFVGWGESSYFTEYSPSGGVLFDGRLAAGTVSYRAFKQPWTGRPAAPPDLAVAGSSGGLTLSASWNGATEVAHWRVLGGSAPTALSPLASAARTGFETQIHVNSSPAWVAVEALDGAGQTLGQSAPQQA